MRLTHFVLLGSLAAATPLLGADRLTDRDVKAVVSRIEEGRDRFDDALDDRLKRSIIRGANGEVNVERFLDDFQENIDRLEERLKPEYAGSAEAATLLRQASEIDRFFRQQPAGTKGESEWNRLTRELGALAGAYGTAFPLAEGATVRRIGDRELAGTADEIARASDRLKKSLDSDLKKDLTVAKSARRSIVRDAGLLSKSAKALSRRLKDGKPSSGEAETLLSEAAKLREFVGTHTVPSSAGTWADIAPRLQTVAEAYRISATTTW